MKDSHWETSNESLISIFFIIVFKTDIISGGFQFNINFGLFGFVDQIVVSFALFFREKISQRALWLRDFSSLGHRFLFFVQITCTQSNHLNNISNQFQYMIFIYTAWICKINGKRLTERIKLKRTGTNAREKRTHNTQRNKWDMFIIKTVKIYHSICLFSVAVLQFIRERKKESHFYHNSVLNRNWLPNFAPANAIYDSTRFGAFSFVWIWFLCGIVCFFFSHFLAMK